MVGLTPSGPGKEGSWTLCQCDLFLPVTRGAQLEIGCLARDAVWPPVSRV